MQKQKHACKHLREIQTGAHWPKAGQGGASVAFQLLPQHSFEGAPTIDQSLMSVKIHYRNDGHLNETNTYSSAELMWIFMHAYADDIAHICDEPDDLQLALAITHKEYSIGARISL